MSCVQLCFDALTASVFFHSCCLLLCRLEEGVHFHFEFVSITLGVKMKFFVCEAVKNLFKTCSALSLDWRSWSQNGSCLKKWLRVTMIRSSRAFRSSKTLWWWREAWRGLMDATIPSYCDLRKTVKLEEYQGLMGVRTSVIPVGIGAPRASGSSRSQVEHNKNPTWVSA